ncbi:MAG TPA: hypothetical protein VFT52_01385 [Luteimonas sp.]|jgi:hypothetical protein|nr:hypothetical protein [Luteimonas sp.]
MKALRQGLFTEYLERVSGKLLEDEYRQVIAKMIRGHAGVYALYKGDRLYYVGLATNLMGRVKQHLRDRHAKRWDRFSVYLAAADEHIKPLESLLLRIALPAGNRVGGRLPGAVDQRRRLHREMREHDAGRHADLLGGHLARRRVRKATAKAQGTRVLDGRLERRIALKAEYKGKRYLATLRKDGFIACGGEKYPSPTAAAHRIVGRNVNGWRFWHYRNGAKGWVPLDQLRK